MKPTDTDDTLISGGLGWPYSKASSDDYSCDSSDVYSTAESEQCMNDDHSTSTSFQSSSNNSSSASSSDEFNGSSDQPVKGLDLRSPMVKDKVSCHVMMAIILLTFGI